MQVVLILLKKMDLLLTKTPKEAVQFHVLPMVFQALEAPSDQVQVRVGITLYFYATLSCESCLSLLKALLLNYLGTAGSISAVGPELHFVTFWLFLLLLSRLHYNSVEKTKNVQIKKSIKIHWEKKTLRKISNSGNMTSSLQKFSVQIVDLLRSKNSGGAAIG